MRAPRNIRLTVSFCFAAACAVWSISAHAWGQSGHEFTNGLAIDDLPAALKPLYDANRNWVVKHSMDPDVYWRGQSRLEGPHHFIDLDTWGADAADHFPNDYWIACGLYGQQAVDKNGVVPWRIGSFYGKLVAAFKKKDPKQVIEISTWLGHYAADAHVPFHATANYDGQLSGQKGIHARFETAMVDQAIKPADLAKSPAALIDDPVRAAFGWVRDSLRLCTAVLEADKAASLKDAGYGATYYSSFTPPTRPIAIKRLVAGGHDLASLWYTAWVAAGKPMLPATDVHAGQPDGATHDPDLIET